MVERVVWERIGIHPTGSNQNAQTPWHTGICGFSAISGIARKSAFDHMADYRQLRLSIS